MGWDLDDRAARSPAQRQADWEREHVRADYANVFSVTEDAGLRARLIAAVGPLPAAGQQRVLVAGCGSRTWLERDLLDAFPQAEVWASDFPAVTALAAQRFCDPRLRWRGRDSSRLRWRSCADAALLVNAMLSDSHRENEAILRSVSDALRPGGVLVGLFPTVQDMLEAAEILDDPRVAGTVDAATCISRDETGEVQRYYGPLRLRRMLRQAGLRVERFEIVFLDSDHFRGQGTEPYRDDDPDVMTYEQLVIARKPSR